MKNAGFDLGRDGYFAKSDDGLWIRSFWDKERGVIDLSWQERTVNVDGKIQWLDENGEVERIEDARFAKYPDDPWVSVGTIQLDRPGMVEFSRKEMRRVIESIMCHSARLFALGYGEQGSDVVEWFTRPEDGIFIIAGEYRIIEGYGILEGSDGLLMDVIDLENDVLSAVVKVGDDERFDLKKGLEPGMLRDFLISTEPV